MFVHQQTYLILPISKRQFPINFKNKLLSYTNQIKNTTQIKLDKKYNLNQTDLPSSLKKTTCQTQIQTAPVTSQKQKSNLITRSTNIRPNKRPFKYKINSQLNKLIGFQKKPRSHFTQDQHRIQSGKFGVASVQAPHISPIIYRSSKKHVGALMWMQIDNYNKPTTPSSRIVLSLLQSRYLYILGKISKTEENTLHVSFLVQQQHYCLQLQNTIYQISPNQVEH
eukprot:TRINITY_DN6641_c0_g2_i3.p1 TRINITY_DN6641_c0_g2~~TRINITY_DN6641_c0_g2_i3.p1  ORF type:complete len:224 (+),score=2.12 TRINITY_DN6641_c0_g2_i3:571-1242(+)